LFVRSPFPSQPLFACVSVPLPILATRPLGPLRRISRTPGPPNLPRQPQRQPPSLAHCDPSCAWLPSARRSPRKTSCRYWLATFSCRDIRGVLPPSSCSCWIATSSRPENFRSSQEPATQFGSSTVTMPAPWFRSSDTGCAKDAVRRIFSWRLQIQRELSSPSTPASLSPNSKSRSRKVFPSFTPTPPLGFRCSSKKLI